MEKNNIEDMRAELVAEAEEYFKTVDTQDYQNFLATIQEKEDSDFDFWFSHLSKKEQEDFYEDYVADQVLMESENI